MRQSAERGVAVVKSDSTVLPVTSALWVGDVGDLTVMGVDGITYTLKNVQVGYHPLRVIKVMAATTAADIVALYF